MALLEETLSREEIERAAAFHFLEDRERHVVARGGLRVVLGHHLGMKPAQLRLGVNSHGKPMLAADSAGADDIRFNLSHSGAFVLLVLARGREVGVDVEQIRDDLPHLDMAARFFSVAEHAALVAQPPSHRVLFFFETWTRKEAYVKGRGGGLSIPTQEFSVHVDGTTPHPVDDGAGAPSPGSWRVAGIEAATGYAAAVAVEGTGWRVRCLDADQALHGASTA